MAADGLAAQLALLVITSRDEAEPPPVAHPVAAAAAFVWQGIILGYAALSPELLVGMFVLRVLSGAILAGAGGKYLAEALAATGVLRGFALGQEWLRRQRAA